MTPTERARRSDALYYETVSVNRRVLCDMIANRESDLEDARAENAKLRKDAAETALMLGAAWEHCSKLREFLQDLAEHIREDDGFGLDYGWMLDRMRELVRAAYNCTNAGPSCLECRIVAGGCTLLSAMRELGVDE